jgi:hypothetical protein
MKCTVEPWYPQVHSSKETTGKERPQIVSMHRVHRCTADA